MTYVVPMSRVMVVVSATVNLVVLVGALTAVTLSVVKAGGELTTGTWAAWAAFVAVAVGIFAWNHMQVRRRCYLVRRLALLPAPSGGYRVRPRRERR